MHAMMRRLHGQPAKPATQATPVETKGLVLNAGRTYDLMEGPFDALVFGGGLGTMRRRALALAELQPGARILDVGCGTGTLALMAQRRVGSAGSVAGIDPGPKQIARARAKAQRNHQPADFQVGAIERLPFADQSFDVVFSTLMMHHLPAPLKRAGLAEVARVLKPGGRLVIGDFARKQDRQGLASHFHAGGSDMAALADMARDAGLTVTTTATIPAPHLSIFPGASFLLATKFV